MALELFVCSMKIVCRYEVAGFTNTVWKCLRILSQDDVAAADALLLRIADSISKLSDYPNMGSVLSDEEYTLIKRGYRFIAIHPYLVFCSRIAK